MQNPIPGNPLAGIPQVNNKDPIPFFLKIIVTIILGLATLCIIHPDTRKTLANLPNDVFYKGQVWRLFTTEFITFSAIDCLFAMFLAYASIGKFVRIKTNIVKTSRFCSLHHRLHPGRTIDVSVVFRAWTPAKFGHQRFTR